MTGQIRHEALRLLLLETDRALVRIVSEQLSQSRHVTVTIEHATSLEQARATESHFDIIMTDLWLSDAFGFEVLDRLADRRCPIIVLGSGAEPWHAVRALRDGVQDFLHKEDLTERVLVRSILFAIERNRREAGLREQSERLLISNERLERLAETDPLTLVLNRRGLERAMFDRSVPRRLPPCAMLVDCDDFKLINDIHGYAAGDDVLREIANRLATSLRSTDSISRVGGDEFLILLPDTSEVEAIGIADRAREKIRRQPISTAAGNVSTTVSISVCAMHDHEASVEQALLQLHVGILESKQMGKDRVSRTSDLPVLDVEKFAAVAK